jgi:hypothetical protein
MVTAKSWAILKPKLLLAQGVVCRHDGFAPIRKGAEVNGACQRALQIVLDDPGPWRAENNLSNPLS